MADLRVLVVAQDSLARAGLATLLREQRGCDVVGQIAADGGVSVGIEVYLPDAVVWDLGWDLASGLEQLSDLAESGPPVLGLVADAADAGQAWSAGARGILRRDSDAASLFAALQAVASGLGVFDPNFSGPGPPVENPILGQAPGLTPREQETLLLLADGLPNKTIASRLSISEHTVKFHVNSILSKLGAQSRTEAVARATRQGLIHL